ncbi:PAS domain S-box protein [Deinococcus sp. A31D244]|uniref:PAS domain-containing sensor histidine kinase n=1 Tax=Deinococcus sp. A31D244 TaxID=3397675 RepID=UPI0039E10AFC
MTDQSDSRPLTRPGFSGADAPALLLALPDPLLLIAADGTAHLNPAAQTALTDAAPQPGGGRVTVWTALFTPEVAGVLRAPLEAALEGQTARASVVLRPDGSVTLVTAAPAAPGPDGEARALLHLRETGAPLSVALDFMDGLGLGVAVQGHDSRILQVNPSATRILGLSEAQLSGRDSLDPRWRAIHPDGLPFPGDTHPSNAALRSGQTIRDVPMGIYRPEPGDWRWLHVTAIPHTLPGQDTPEQVTTVFADVTDRYRMEADLRGSEQRFRSLVEATTQIVWDAHPDGTFLPPQPGWEAFTGQSEASYSYVGWLNAVHPEDRARTIECWQRATLTRQPYLVEHRLRRADGTYVPMQARAVPVIDDGGQIREWVGTHTDMSDVREAQQALIDLNADLERRVQARTLDLANVTRFSTLLLTAAGEGIFGLDLRGVTTFANPAAARMLGYSVERMIGHSQHELVHHHHADGREYPLHDCPIHQTIQDGQTRRVDRDVMWHAQGYPVPVAYVVTPTRDEAGAVSGAVVMVQDTTERERAQAQLRDVIENLERSNQDLEQFAYVASHDLQEPLRTVGSYTELLVRRYQGQLDPRADQYLHYMQDAVTRMRSLIQDLLGFARVGRQETPLEPTDLRVLLQAAEQNVRATLEQGGGTLEWHTPHAVLGRPSLLLQLLTNLISNGLKFRAEDRLPRVQVRSELDGEFVHITVQDNGIGIAPEYHTRVFDIFQRLHLRETFAGNGMGLAICRKIVEFHGGRIWLESLPGQGSTFHLTLPVAPTS